MTQLIRVFVTKPGDLCLIPRTHMVGENKPPPQKKMCPLTSTHKPWQALHSPWQIN